MSASNASTSASSRSVNDSMNHEPPSGSMTDATPVSSRITCCVRSATSAAASVGSPSTSSSALVCSELVPPRTAASASMAVRTTLFCGCCAVSDTPAVCVWKRSHCARSIGGAVPVTHPSRPDPASRSKLGDLFEEVDVRVEEEAQSRERSR